MGGGSANMPCAGCRSDDTIKISRYYLNTPLPDGRGGGGGQMGGRKGRGRGKMVPHKRGMRGMKGGDGSFWNFAKFWNPNTGGNILSLSDKGTSPTGLGAPLTTSGDKPIPPIQPWPAQKLVLPHDYTKGGMQFGGGKKIKKGKKRGLKGGSIIDDVQAFGRDIVYKMGSAVNSLSGYDNKIYNNNPSPAVQFTRGLGNVTTGASSYSSLNLKNIYDKSYADASLK